MILRLHLKKSAALIFIPAAVVTIILMCFIFPFDGNAETNANAISDGIQLPIIMYHSVCINKKADSQYIITPERFEEDMCYLQSHGYETVFITDVINYVKNNGTLPEKPVVISLDDGFFNNLTNVLPILAKYKMRANVNIVGEYTESYCGVEKKSPAYAYLSWEDIKTLHGSGLIEIGSHSYSMHCTSPRNGCKMLPGETAERYKSVLTADLTRLADKLKNECGITCNVFAYPFGALCSESVPILRSLGFEAALTCNEKINRLTHDNEILFNLGRINRGSRYTTEEFMSKYDIK